MKEVPKFASYTPQELAAEARARKNTEGNAISLKAALGLVFQRIGRDIIKRTLTPISGRGTVAEDIGSLLAGLSPEGMQQFLLGFGGIYLGTTIATLELAAVNGWEDEFFVTNYNLAIVGTQLPQLKLEVLNGLTQGPRRSPREETVLIQQELRYKPTFLGFFNPENRNSLPQILQSHIYEKRYLREAISRIVPFYREAVKYL